VQNKAKNSILQNFGFIFSPSLQLASLMFLKKEPSDTIFNDKG